MSIRLGAANGITSLHLSLVQLNTAYSEFSTNVPLTTQGVLFHHLRFSLFVIHAACSYFPTNASLTTQGVLLHHLHVLNLK